MRSEYCEEIEKDNNVNKISKLFYNLILNHLQYKDDDNKFNNICSTYIKNSIKEIRNIPEPYEESYEFAFYSFEPANDIDKIMKKLYDEIYKYLCNVDMDCPATGGFVDNEIKNILSRNIDNTIKEIQNYSGSHVEV